MEVYDYSKIFKVFSKSSRSIFKDSIKLLKSKILSFNLVMNSDLNLIVPYFSCNY